jgi:hypothetical protein
MTPALLVFAIKIASSASPGSGDLTLPQLLACHDSAVGGPALRAVQRLEYRISIEEGGTTLRGRYRATRDGRMRIDVFAADSTRVFSEGWDGQHGWELPQGAAASTPASPPAAAALRHGLAQPGHLWTLADMKRNGHAVALAGRETIDTTSYYVVRLTLSDGFRVWYLLDPTTCLIVRKRDFRAFHPNLDRQQKWVESVFDEFRSEHGITRPYRERSVDRATGKTLSTTRVLAIDLEPRFDPGTMTARPNASAPMPP